MANYNQKQSSLGFSILAIVISIAVIIGLSVGGLYVWNKNHKSSQSNKDNNSSQTNNSNNSSNSNTGNNNSQSDPSEGGKYLVIKEWGVRFEVPEGLRGDISYFENDRAHVDFGGPILMDILSKKFSSGTQKCAVQETTPRSLISLEEIDLNINPVTPSTIPQPFKTIGNKAYSFSATPCEEAINREGSDEYKKLLADLKYAIANTMEAVN